MGAETKPTRSPHRRLLTRDQVLAALRQERGMLGLTATAEKYGLKPSQVCDVLAIPPRANLSKKMAEALSFQLVEMYRKVGRE